MIGTFLKYVGASLAAQVGAVVACSILIAMFPLLQFAILTVLTVYAPTILLVSVAGNFKGEAAMIQPILLGVPAGMLLYSLIFARVMLHSSLRRAQSK